jgi:hypothetical protein
MTLSFTAAGAPPAAKPTRVLSVTQNANNICNEEKSYFCSQIRGSAQNYPSTV